MKSATTKPQSILNRRARFDYSLGEEIIAGVVLSGREVRAIRDGRAQLKGAFVTVKDNELWLNNASLSLKGDGKETTVDTTPRKLLVHRKQLEQLIAAKTQGLTIVPVKILRDRRYIKVIIATAKGKKTYDKRETIKRREQEREAKSSTKRSLR